MNAKYFYSRLLGYDEECRKIGKYYYGYCNRMVTIHHKNDETSWFVIHADGTVYRETIGSHKIEKLKIGELKGDDFELFNIVQILKSGYLVLNTETELEVKQTISDLYKLIDSFDDGELFEKNKNIPILCGGSFWEDGVTDEFQYYATNGIEIHVQMIRNLCKSNINRKYYGLRCIPFIKSISNAQAIHVEFIQNMNKGNYNEEYDKCEEALKELKIMLNEITDSFRWVKCNMGKPCYC